MTPVSPIAPQLIRLAIPVANGRLHGHFGGCREFALVEADAAARTVLDQQVVPAPPHQPGLFPLWLREQGVTVVIAGGIGRRALEAFNDYGITVRAGQADTLVTTLVEAFLNGQLTTSPEGCTHHGQDHHHDHHHDHDHATPPPG